MHLFADLLDLYKHKIPLKGVYEMKLYYEFLCNFYVT